MLALALGGRNIKGFIVQTGDPTNTGKGGESIWGRKFADEFRPALKHNARGIVSMANSGPDTNASQFFITYAKHTHLDHVYTIFGKYVRPISKAELSRPRSQGRGLKAEV